MGKGMSILIVLAGKAFLMIFTSDNGALFRPFRLVRQHVGLEILEYSSTVGVWAAAFFVVLFVHLETAGSLAVQGVSRVVGGNGKPSRC